MVEAQQTKQKYVPMGTYVSIKAIEKETGSEVELLYKGARGTKAGAEILSSFRKALQAAGDRTVDEYEAHEVPTDTSEETEELYRVGLKKILADGSLRFLDPIFNQADEIVGFRSCTYTGGNLAENSLTMFNDRYGRFESESVRGQTLREVQEKLYISSAA